MDVLKLTIKCSLLCISHSHSVRYIGVCMKYVGLCQKKKIYNHHEFRWNLPIFHLYFSILFYLSFQVSIGIMVELTGRSNKYSFLHVRWTFAPINLLPFLLSLSISFAHTTHNTFSHPLHCIYIYIYERWW